MTMPRHSHKKHRAAFDVPGPVLQSKKNSRNVPPFEVYDDDETDVPIIEPPTEEEMREYDDYLYPDSLMEFDYEG